MLHHSWQLRRKSALGGLCIKAEYDYQIFTLCPLTHPLHRTTLCIMDGGLQGGALHHLGLILVYIKVYVWQCYIEPNP